MSQEKLHVAFEMSEDGSRLTLEIVKVDGTRLNSEDLTTVVDAIIEEACEIEKVDLSDSKFN